MVSQATKEYLKNMYDRDRNDDEKIINRVENLDDKLQEILDVLKMMEENQRALLLWMHKFDVMIGNRNV